MLPVSFWISQKWKKKISNWRSSFVQCADISRNTLFTYSCTSSHFCIPSLICQDFAIQILDSICDCGLYNVFFAFHTCTSSLGEVSRSDPYFFHVLAVLVRWADLTPVSHMYFQSGWGEQIWPLFHAYTCGPGEVSRSDPLHVFTAVH